MEQFGKYPQLEIIDTLFLLLRSTRELNEQ